MTSPDGGKKTAYTSSYESKTCTFLKTLLYVFGTHAYKTERPVQNFHFLNINDFFSFLFLLKTIILLKALKRL